MPTSETILQREPDIAALSAVAEPATEADTLVVGLVPTEDGPVLRFGPDGSVGAEVTALVRAVGASTKVGATTVLPAPDSVVASTVIAVGLGGETGASSTAGAQISDETLRRAAGSAARTARGKGTALLLLDPARPEQVALGAALGSYRAAKVTAKDQDASRSDSVLVHSTASDADQAVARAAEIARAVGLARDLVNTPPNLLYPASFAEKAAQVGRDAGLEVEILDEQALAEGGFGGILGVGSGSSRPPRLLRMTHRAASDRPTIGLVGKGVTFDTGGISIKPAAGMEKMTSDMGGAAAVVAATILAARLGVDATVIATVPMAENMPSATAYRPGDVLTLLGGTTVEVLNTDAEGRLILADALVRACQDAPDYLVDTATLTGAQMVALGNRTPGVMGDDEFRDRVARLSQEIGEDGWPMPMPEEIRDGLDSTVADLANVTPTRWGGMLAAALFLSEFVADGISWAHIDVAGPAFNDSGATGYLPKGGTGVPVRTLLAVLEDIAAHG